MKFSLDTRTKLKFSLNTGYYKPGDAVDDTIPGDMWAITSGVVISNDP